MAQFGARLQQLGASYNLLLDEPDKDVAISDLVKAHLAVWPAFQHYRRSGAGSGHGLSGTGEQWHKHGALSTPSGRVEMPWKHLKPEDGPDALFKVEWGETGGPQVEVPSEQEFVSTVLGPLTQTVLNGEVDLVYAPAGIIWRAKYELKPLSTDAASGGNPP